MRRWSRELQDHVKREIAPYKYPRAIEFVAQLPKTGTGKLQRFALRQMARPARRRPACRGMKSRMMERRVSMQRGPPSPSADYERRGVDAGPQVLQPSGWPMPKGYANGMAADGRLVVTGGVIGWDIEGRLPDDFIGQVRQTLSNISAILAEGGAKPEHLVRLTWYVVDIEEYLANLKALGQVYREIFRHALSGDGAGSGGAPRRKSRTRRDRGDRGGAALRPHALLSV